MLTALASGACGLGVGVLLERRQRAARQEPSPDWGQSTGAVHPSSSSSGSRRCRASTQTPDRSQVENLDEESYSRGLDWLRDLLPECETEEDLESLLQKAGSSLTLRTARLMMSRHKVEEVFSVPVQERSKHIFGLGRYAQHNRVMLCMVGLPARGKSYITKMLRRYLQWLGFPVKAINAGELRRQKGMAGAPADFFTGDKKAVQVREDIANQCMEMAFEWLSSQEAVCIAIFDATNTTKKRRQVIVNGCQERGFTPVFVESICTDEKILEANYEMKLINDDYKASDPVKARQDFLDRVKAYEGRYETVEDDECDGAIRYIKLFNVGEKVIMKRCSGYISSNIGFYLSNIHICPRKIWLMRHAETEEQRKGQLGSVSDVITYLGARYCRDVAKSVYEQREEMRKAGEIEGADVLILTGTAPIHAATCEALKVANSADGDLGRNAAEVVARFPVMSTSLLNELDGGDFNGMTNEVIKQDFPELWAMREQDRLNFRYPGAGGESFVDVIHRLGPVIIELERQHRSLLIVSHLAVQKCIYGYFMNTPLEEIPHLDLEMHTLYELTPGPHGTQVTDVKLKFDRMPPMPSLMSVASF